MRPPIVDPGGILLKEMEKKLAKASADRRERMRLHMLNKAQEAKDAKDAKEAKDARKAQQEAAKQQAVKKKPKKKDGTPADNKELPVAATEDAPTASAKTSVPVPEPNSVTSSVETADPPEVAEPVVVAPPKYICVGPVIISL